MRAFVAVPLPAPIRAQLLAVGAALSRVLPAVKWVRKEENFHVTMKFLGNDVSEQRLNELAVALGDELSAVPAFGIAVQGWGAFPSVQRANVIWAAVDDPTGGLLRIATIVRRLTPASGPPADADARPFRAHVTIGRAKVPVDARLVSAHVARSAFGAFTVKETHIYESRLGPHGSTYSLRSRVELQATAASDARGHE